MAVQGGRTSKLFIHCSVRIFCLMCFRNSMISVGMKDQLMFLLFYMCNHCVFMKCWFVELVGGNLMMVILLFSEGRRLHFWRVSREDSQHRRQLLSVIQTVIQIVIQRKSRVMSRLIPEYNMLRYETLKPHIICKIISVRSNIAHILVLLMLSVYHAVIKLF